VSSRLALWLTAALATALTASMVAFPDLAFQAALRGLRIWWFVVFPALLPFFVAGQVLMALGVVHFLGALLERFMRPLFRVPGVGAFVVAMGLASGYPIGAVLTARLLREGALEVAEAERLVSFCNTADPLFMAGAVAVGMFRRPALAGPIMAAHYVAALGTGLALRFYGPAGRARPEPDGRPALLRAAEALMEARRRDGRPFGQILGDAVRQAVETLLLVGGLIILFAVVIDVLGRLGLVGAAARGLAWLLGPLGLGRGAARALVSGFFEITIGTQAASEAAAPLVQRVAVANAIIAWSGLSVLAQVAAVTEGTGMSLRPYVLARLLQAVLAAGLTFVFWNPAWAAPAAAVPALGPVVVGLSVSWWRTLGRATLLLAGVLVVGIAALAVAWRPRLLVRAVRASRPKGGEAWGRRTIAGGWRTRSMPAASRPAGRGASQGAGGARQAARPARWRWSREQGGPRGAGSGEGRPDQA
jgi:sporulation integral membrane protein YlbJ